MMEPVESIVRAVASWPWVLESAARGLRNWSHRQVLVAIVAAAAFGSLLGVATVLIPNSYFARDIAPVWWNYPVWLLTSASVGMLVATYVRRPAAGAGADGRGDVDQRRPGRLGIAGSVLAWF